MADNAESPALRGADPLVLDVVDLAIEDGEFERASWVYVWLDDAAPARVVYVGATWLPPAARAFLHLHDPDPSIGRIRVEHPELLDGRAAVRAFRIDPELDRHMVKAMVMARLQGEVVAGTTDEGRAALEVVSLLRASAA
jgi:hypothetical protein